MARNLRQNSLSMCTDSDLAFCNSYEDGTSTNSEPSQAYKTAEVGHSQLWIQCQICEQKLMLVHIVKYPMYIICSQPFKVFIPQDCEGVHQVLQSHTVQREIFAIFARSNTSSRKFVSAKISASKNFLLTTSRAQFFSSRTSSKCYIAPSPWHGPWHGSFRRKRLTRFEIHAEVTISMREIVGCVVRLVTCGENKNRETFSLACLLVIRETFPLYGTLEL